MEELIKEIRKLVVRCELSRRKVNRTELEKKQLDAMINAYNNVIFEIEINKKYYIQEVLNNVKSEIKSCKDNQ